MAKHNEWWSRLRTTRNQRNLANGFSSWNGGHAADQSASALAVLPSAWLPGSNQTVLKTLPMAKKRFGFSTTRNPEDWG
jgi:hypothetical protein